MNISRRDAETWATCFSALGDPTRIVIVNLLATATQPLTVGEIVDAVAVGQSTVSHHLRVLETVGFVAVQRVGTASLWRINEDCVTCLPTAADVVMGQSTRDTPWAGRSRAVTGKRRRKAG